MSGSLREKLAEMYQRGQSIPQISGRTGINKSRVRAELLKAGIALRSRAEGVRIREGLGQHAKGTSLKPSGYIEFTRGQNKGRSEHVVKMESRLGRPLREDEQVHHIDRDRSNNSDDNLALVTRAGHGRLHRFEDSLSGIERKRANGRFY